MMPPPSPFSSSRKSAFILLNIVAFNHNPYFYFLFFISYLFLDHISATLNNLDRIFWFFCFQSFPPVQSESSLKYTRNTPDYIFWKEVGGRWVLPLDLPLIMNKYINFSYFFRERSWLQGRPRHLWDPKQNLIWGPPASANTIDYCLLWLLAIAICFISCYFKYTG